MSVRSEAQNAELTDLLRQRVEQFYGADPSSGYATHLAAALDYRQWHEVTVTILGPEEGQQRRLVPARQAIPGRDPLRLLRDLVRRS